MPNFIGAGTFSIKGGTDTFRRRPLYFCTRYRKVSVCEAQEVETDLTRYQNAVMANRRIYDSERHAQFVTFSCYHRRRLLDHERMRETLVAILANKLELYHGICCGFVIMPDHVHSIVWFPEIGALSRFLKGWKQTSSLKLKAMLRGLLPNYAKTCDPSGAFWQAKYYPFNLYSEKKAKEKLDYMHLNPVRAQLVERAVQWKWSSARFYELGECVGVPLQWIF